MTSDEHSIGLADARTDGPASALAEAPDVSDLIPVDAAAKGSIRVLVVDDDRTLRESCAKFLEIEGYDVTVARQGEEGLDLLKQQPFQIVLLDLYMSGVPG